MVNSSSFLNITYSMPTVYAAVFYVRMDELFRNYASDNFTCWINGTVVGCKRVRPDLVLVNNTMQHGFKYVNTLMIKAMHYFYK